MIEQIQRCEKCSLCFNQRPLLDSQRSCQVIWVGLSAKKKTLEVEAPLSPHTSSGLLIKKIEEKCSDVVTYKTNLVKCLPLSERGTLRYPTKKEIDCCFENLLCEIHTLSPQIVFLLGEKVSSSVAQHFHVQFDKWHDFDYRFMNISGIYYVPVHHPSYINVYRRKMVERYILSIAQLMDKLLNC